MDALKASYGSDSDSDESSSRVSIAAISGAGSARIQFAPLPPPPAELLDLPSSIGALPSLQASRVRNFPHIEGNYALHVFIPVIIPPTRRKDIASFIRRFSSNTPNLFAVDLDVPLVEGQKIEQTLGIEFHVSLGRTVPIKVHQIDSIVSMLLQRLQVQRQYSIGFNRWAVFVNDERTRTFLSLEVEGLGLCEINRQIQTVNDVYRLHGLPEFYKDPRPHISVAWAAGDVSGLLSQVLKSLNPPEYFKNSFFMSRFSGITCKIGKKSYNVCKLSS